jgi:hypothetical protein
LEFPSVRHLQTLIFAQLTSSVVGDTGVYCY